MELAPADLTRVRELYTQGRYRQAYDAANALGPLREWSGTAARLIGGRLAIQLGAPKLGRRMHLAAFRATPAYPEAIYYHARYRMERFGPLSTWRFMRDHPDWSDAPPELHADWVALHGFVVARLRDFDRAERLLNRAETITPDRPWPCIERSSVYEFADRPDDAMTAARRSLELHPWFRPGVQSVAHLLLRQGRDREALDFLTEADRYLESGLVSAQLAALQTDLGHYADARRTLDRYAELSPLIEPEVAKWLAARRADSAYFLGEPAVAARFAREVKDEFYDKFAERLSARGEGPGARGEEETDPDSASALAPESRFAIRLDFPPAPAVPTVYELLARFWNHPLPDMSEGPPPGDGLPDAAERQRAEAAGWVGREFTLSLEVAAALVARGVPFLVTLVEAGFSQPRLCVGADAMRGSVSVIDGQDRRSVDAPVGSLTKRFGPFGPRCLIVVPAAEAGKLDGLPELADADAREALYAVQKPLLAHDRGAAENALRVMRDRFPDSRFTTFGELALARYDAHPLRLLALYDALLASFPHESTWVLSKANVLRELNRMPERESLLEAESARLDAEPMVAQTFAQAILAAPAPPSRGGAAAAPLRSGPPDGCGRLLPARDAVVGGAAVRRGGRAVPLRLHAGGARGPVRRRVLPRRPRHGAGAGGAAAVPVARRPRRGAGPGRDARPVQRADGPRRTRASVRRRRSGDSQTAGDRRQETGDREQEEDGRLCRTRRTAPLPRGMSRRGGPVRGGRRRPRGGEAARPAGRVAQGIRPRRAHPAGCRHRRRALPRSGQTRTAVDGFAPHAHRAAGRHRRPGGGAHPPRADVPAVPAPLPAGQAPRRVPVRRPGRGRRSSPSRHDRRPPGRRLGAPPAGARAGRPQADRGGARGRDPRRRTRAGARVVLLGTRAGPQAGRPDRRRARRDPRRAAPQRRPGAAHHGVGAAQPRAAREAGRAGVHRSRVAPAAAHRRGAGRVRRRRAPRVPGRRGRRPHAPARNARRHPRRRGRTCGTRGPS